MVALVSGNSLGLNLTSLATLGARGVAGNASIGRGTDRAYVNVSNGNLVLQNRDDALAGPGLWTDSLRTYNSQEHLGGDFRLPGLQPPALTSTGGIGKSNSSVVRKDADGGEDLYTWDGIGNGYGEYQPADLSLTANGAPSLPMQRGDGASEAYNPAADPEMQARAQRFLAMNPIASNDIADPSQPMSTSTNRLHLSFGSGDNTTVDESQVPSAATRFVQDYTAKHPEATYEEVQQAYDQDWAAQSDAHLLRQAQGLYGSTESSQTTSTFYPGGEWRPNKTPLDVPLADASAWLKEANGWVSQKAQAAWESVQKLNPEDFAILSPRNASAAAQYWANRQIETGNALYAIPGALAAAWAEHPDEIGMILSMGRSGRLSPEKMELSEIPMLGANGVRTASKTIWKGEGKERIDVENPNPGQRPGQLHFQDNAGALMEWTHPS